MSNYDTVQVERRGSVAIVSLNRPDSLNAFNAGLRSDLRWAVREVNDDNGVEAGAEVFRLTCTRCHTATGVNAVTDRLRAMYGTGPWDRDAVKFYLLGMHTARPFMPPFPGNDREAGALADYLLELRDVRRPVFGAQDEGAKRSPERSAAGKGGV
jgi:mono/diheme cytochrome c family protein